MSNAQLVNDFHRAIDHAPPPAPTVPSAETLRLRGTLIDEEHREVRAELDHVLERLDAGEVVQVEDLAPLAHELADLLYVAYGAFTALGVDADEVFAEVHRANLDKRSGPRRPDGKLLKPAGWRPADVRAVLRRATG